MSKEVLVFDDNSDIRQLISGILKDQGLKVREAANFDQALLEINKKLPDVAIIDVKLDKGDNDGIELLDHLKKIDDDVPAIMISGHANVQMAVDSLKLGAFEFIQKPFSSERLLNFLNRALENVDLKKEKRALESKLFNSYDIVGKSQSIEKVKTPDGTAVIDKNQIKEFMTSIESTDHKKVDEVIDSMKNEDFDRFTRSVIDSVHKKQGYDGQAPAQMA
jgi:DNA-binding NtrC family response regulator